MFKELPVISVVVIALNEEKLVGKCMTALVNQDIKKKYEVIFVDGNSTDDTLKIVRSFRDKLNLKILALKRSGTGYQREMGFRAASAQIIASTDSDGVLPPNWLSTIFSFLGEPKSNKGYVGVVGPYEITTGIYSGKLSLFTQITLDHFVRLITGHYQFRGMNFAILRDVWKKVGGFNTKVSALEDTELANRAVKYGKIKYLSGMVGKTTGRRFTKKFVKVLIYRLMAFYYRNINKNDEKFSHWPP